MNLKRVEELEQELKILLLPKGSNDDKNVIVEIRAGAGGMRLHFCGEKFIVCMYIMQTAADGRQR